MDFPDAAFYATAQFLGAVGGVAIVTLVLRGAPGQAAVHYGVTMGWRVWQHYRLCRGNDDFFYSYEHGLVRVQSRKHRMIHTVLCRRTCCNLLDL
jgi:hypothetical protein